VGALGIATLATTGQSIRFSTVPGYVNFFKLFNAGIVAHECGLTFEKKGKRTSQVVIDSTVEAVAMLQDEQGRVQFEDLQQVKLDRCEEQGVKITWPGRVEVGLIWSFLGGPVRGFVEVSDVERFLNGKVPLTIGEPDLIFW